MLPEKGMTLGSGEPGPLPFIKHPFLLLQASEMGSQVPGMMACQSLEEQGSGPWSSVPLGHQPVTWALAAFSPSLQFHLR